MSSITTRPPVSSGSGSTAPAAVTPTGILQPSHLGCIAITDDAGAGTAGLKPPSGAIMFNFTVAGSAVASGTNVTVSQEITSAAATPTANQNLLGIYALSSDATTLTLIGQSGDMGSTWSATGNKTGSVALTAAISAGDRLYIATLSVASTPPTFRATAVNQLGYATPVRRRLQLNSQTTLPTSLTMSNLASATQAICAAVY